MRGKDNFYRPEIDGLRALAIAVVVLYHAFPKYLPGGFIGVDVFFVISGFLITSIIDREMAIKQFSFNHFYARRFRRLLPALIVVVLTTFLLGAWILSANEFSSLGKHLLATSLFGENFLLWKESGYFDRAAETKPFLHFWSLGVEEQFYLVWPPLLLFGRRLGISTKPLVGVLIVASLYLSATQVYYDLSGTFYNLPTRLWELLLGAGVYFFRDFHFSSDVRPAGREAIILISLAVIVGGSFFIDRLMLYPGIWALVPTLPTALILFFGARSTSAQQILANEPIVRLGLVSYPLYLWHWPLLVFVHLIEDPIATTKLLWIVISLSVLLALLTWRYIEQPIQRRLSTSQPYRIIGFSLLTLSLTAGLGFATWKQAAPAGTSDVTLEPTDWIRSWGSFPCRDHGNYFRDEICKEPRPGSRVAIWGDSHATALQFGFEKLNVPTFTISQGGCPPLVGVRALEGADQHEQCQDANQKVLNYLTRQRTDISTVVLASMNRLYTEGIRNGAPVATVIRDEGPADRFAADIFLNGFRRTLQALLAAKKNVIVYIDQPEFITGMDPHDCVSPRPIRLSPIEKPSCDWSREVFNGQQLHVRPIFETLEKEFPSVHFFKAFDVICSRAVCHGVIGGERMYYDGDHLSLAGGFLMAEKLTQLSRDF